MAENIKFKLDLEQDPQNQKTVGELREEFSRLEEQVDKTKQGTKEYQDAVRSLGQVQGELEKVDRAIESMNPERKAQVIGDAVSGMAGGFQAAVGAAELFGVENEAVLESLQRVNAVMAITEGITAFSEKIPAMKTLIATMPRLTSALKGARVGVQGLSAATKALGIGLLISAVALLVTHWEDIKEVISDVIPGMGDLEELFGKVTSGVKALAAGIASFVTGPARTMYKFFTGDFSGALDEVKSGFGAVDSASETYAENELERQRKLKEEALEGSRAILQETIQRVEKERALLEKRGEDTTQIENQIFEMKKALYDEDSQEYRDLIQDKNIADEERDIKEEENHQKRLENIQKREQEAAEALRNAREGVDTGEGDTTQMAGSDGLEGMEDVEGAETGQRLFINGQFVTMEEFERMREQGQLSLLQSLKTGILTREEARTTQLENELEFIDAELEAEEEGSARYIELQKQKTQASIELSEAEKDARLNNLQAVGSAVGALGSFVGEQTALGKALGIVQATIDTYVGANKALAQGGIAGPFAAAGIIATGLANVRKIATTNVPNDGGSSFNVGGASAAGASSAPSVGSVAAPEFNETGVNTVNTVLSDEERERQDRPVKAYVVETDITETQNRVNEIEKQASF